MPDHVEEGLTGGEDLARLRRPVELRGIAAERLEFGLEGLGDVGDEGRLDLVLAKAIA